MNEGIARRGVLALAASGFAASAAASEPASDLEEALRIYERATLGSDIAALDELVVEDFILVNSDTSVQDKQSFLADFAVPGFRVDAYAIEQPFHRALDNAALTGGVLRLGWTLSGERHARNLRVAHVWSRREGRWRLLYTQLTRAP